MNWIDMVMEALSGYTKAELEAGMKGYVTKFIVEKKSFLDERGIMGFEPLLKLRKYRKYRKSDLLELCAIPFLEKETFQAFLQTLPAPLQILFKELTYNKSLNSDEIEQKFNIRIADREYHKSSIYGYNPLKVKREFNIFKELETWSYGPSPARIYIPGGLRVILLDYFDIPEEANLQAVSSPVPTEYVYEAGEENISQELFRLIAYQQQGQIKLTSKDRPVHSTISKMNRSLNIKEFFAGNKNKLFKHLRTQFLAYLIVYLAKKDIQLPAQELIKKLILEGFQEKFGTPAMVLSHLKGMGYLTLRDFEYFEFYILKMLSNFPQEEWLSIENIKENIKYTIPGLEPLRPYNLDKLYFQFDDPKHYTDRHDVKGYSYSDVIVEPFIKGLFFFFASWGLVDIAYNLPTDPEVLGKTYYSPYDGLKYVRLTSLGAYVLGKKNEYEFSGNEKHSLVLSSDALIITADPDDATAEIILDPYSRKITPQRYLVENQIFLKNIKTKKELKNRIDLFKQSLELKEFPNNWNTFFKELELKVNSLIEIKKVKVFKIPEDNQPLRMIIAKDPTLKKLILKAEDFHILLFEANAAKFRKRLQELGYLLT